jgi:hypothetical protein
VRDSQEIDGEHDLQVYGGLTASIETTQGFLEANVQVNILFQLSRPTDATCDKFLFSIYMCKLYMFRASIAHHQESLTVHTASSFCVYVCLRQSCKGKGKVIPLQA